MFAEGSWLDMEHGHSLVLDLCWLLLAAGVASVVCHAIRQPAILGYLLAGFLLGPNLSHYSPIHGLENIQELSELGVIFLMFYIGLEFDFNKLRQVMVPAVAALVLQTGVMLFLGFRVGALLEWGAVESLFLGGLLSISSSMVTITLMRQKGEMSRNFAHLTIGVLILEDVLAILLLVLLTGVAVSGKFAWDAVGNITFLVGMFVVVVFLAGKLVAPRIVHSLKKLGDAESITLFTVGLIFGVSLLAQKLEFSMALGGFLAGAILSRTALTERIEHLTEPLRDVCSALFFVSVGMLISPGRLYEVWPIVVVLSLLVVVGKFSACWLGFFIGGQAPDRAARAAMPKVQIGEFSFVIAALGASLEVTEPRLKAIASGVAFSTILLTPLVNSRRDALVEQMGRVIPKALRDIAMVYHNWMEVLHYSVVKSLFLKAAARPLSRLFVNFILLNALVIAGALISNYVPIPESLDPLVPWIRGGALLLTAVLAMPFAVDTLRNLEVIVLLITDTAMSQRQFRMPRMVREGFHVILKSFFGLFFFGLFFAAAVPYLPSMLSLVMFFMVMLVAMALFWRQMVRVHSHMEGAVLKALVDQSKEALTHTMETSLASVSSLNPWPVVMEEVRVGQHTRFLGKKVGELDLREKTGANIIAIHRSGVSLQDYIPEVRVFPGDRLLLFGEKAQIEHAGEYLNQPGNAKPGSETDAHAFEKLLIPPASDLVGLTLKDTDLRKNYGVTVIGIQRKDLKITGPGADEVIQGEDILFVMGSPENLSRLSRAISWI